ASVVEGNSGTTTLTFTVTLSSAAAQSKTLQIYTVDGTARQGNDYIAKNKTAFTFAPGETSRPFNVLVNGDTTTEADEIFKVKIGPTPLSLAKGTGIGTIQNDDTSGAGGKIVFTSNRDGNDEIYNGNTDGNGLHNLTKSAFYDNRPVFSPRGSKIAFYSYYDGGADIY
ncbi:Calx-beta domain-containing protein, partial [Pseudomonas sp. 100_A]|uniref:Calx-beta domain-containing protein n=1 Tax=Pseudomonas sp. 100_A TaxID=2813571 RepID=UPI001A9EBC78